MLRRGHPEFVTVVKKNRRPTLTLKGFRADPAENAAKQAAGGSEQGEQVDPAPPSQPREADAPTPAPRTATPVPSAPERRGLWGSLGVDIGRLFAEAEERFGSVEQKPKIERPVAGPFVRPVAKPTAGPVAKEAAAAPPMETVPHTETPEVHDVSPVAGMTPGVPTEETGAVVPEVSVMPQTSEAPKPVTEMQANPVTEAPVETTPDPVEVGRVEAGRDAGDVSPPARPSEEPPLFPDLPTLKVPGARPTRKETRKAAKPRSRTVRPAAARSAPAAPAQVTPAQVPPLQTSAETSPADTVAENLPVLPADVPAPEKSGPMSVPAELIEWMNAIAALERRRSEIVRDMMRERRNYARRRGELVNALSLAMTELGAPRDRVGDHRKRA